MRFVFRQIEKKDVLAILSWCYTFPYDYYNFDTTNTEENLRYLLNLENAFCAILNLQGELEGYCSFGSDGQVSGGDYSAEALDIGMGIRPDLVGQGYGKQYAQAVMNYGISQYEAQQLRVTIAEFNNRAQRVWERLGFKQVERFVKLDSEEKFVIMSCIV
jgi:[ribosomal protein S18]-alanine N-acetyltransferase